MRGGRFEVQTTVSCLPGWLATRARSILQCEAPSSGKSCRAIEPRLKLPFSHHRSPRLVLPLWASGGPLTHSAALPSQQPGKTAPSDRGETRTRAATRLAHPSQPSGHRHSPAGASQSQGRLLLQTIQLSPRLNTTSQPTAARKPRAHSAGEQAGWQPSRVRLGGRSVQVTGTGGMYKPCQ